MSEILFFIFASCVPLSLWRFYQRYKFEILSRQYMLFMPWSFWVAKAEFILERKAFFHCFVACAFPFLKSWASKAISLHELKKFNFKSVSRSWHMILLLIWKRSVWVCITKQWRLSLNGNATTHRSAMKKLAFEYELSLSADTAPANAVLQNLHKRATFLLPKWPRHE